MTEAIKKNLTWMIYGANGYTAKLIAAKAIESGHRPILAGRTPQKITDLALETGLDSFVFDISNKDSYRFLEGIDVLVNCAGPFSKTVKAALNACLATSTHYLDITGEIDVFEYIHSRSSEIKDAGITAIPGIGFDVVPTDCLAAMLKSELPDAKDLILAFHPGGGGLSPGTTKTMVLDMHKNGKVRKNGKIIEVPPAYKVKEIPFGHKTSTAVTIPWGDVSTAFHSTHIPNIEVYAATNKNRIKALRLMRYFRFLFKFKPITTWALRKAGRKPGPSLDARDSGRCYVYGEASNGTKKIELRLETPEGYKLTSMTTLAAIEAMNKKMPPTGALTPSGAFGPEFIKKIPGVV